MKKYETPLINIINFQDESILLNNSNVNNNGWIEKPDFDNK